MCQCNLREREHRQQISHNKEKNERKPMMPGTKENPLTNRKSSSKKKEFKEAIQKPIRLDSKPVEKELSIAEENPDINVEKEPNKHEKNPVKKSNQL